MSARAWKQKKPTPLDRGPPLHVNRVLVSQSVSQSASQQVNDFGQKLQISFLFAFFGGGGGGGGKISLEIKSDNHLVKKQALSQFND